MNAGCVHLITDSSKWWTKASNRHAIRSMNERDGYALAQSKRAESLARFLMGEGR